MKKCFLVLILLSSWMISQAQSLNETEQKIVRIIDTDMPYHIELLKNAVNINSGTYNKAGVKAVGKLFADEFRALL